jgi:hypothetical protein
MKRIIAAVIALATTGCATDTFTNRVSFTADDSAVLVNSMYGESFGITSRVNAKDAAALIEARKAKEAAARAKP